MALKSREWLAAFVTTATPWQTAGLLANMASTTNHDGTPFTGFDEATTQAAATNRAPGLRLVSSMMDPGAAFVFRIQDKMEFENFVRNLDFLDFDY